MGLQGRVHNTGVIQENLNLNQNEVAFKIQTHQNEVAFKIQTRDHSVTQRHMNECAKNYC